MRAAIGGLGTPYPIGSMLPAIYQSDPTAMAWTAGFDDVLAPVISTLDCLRAYIDPMLAPDDFLVWLAGWFGTSLDENWPLERQRSAVARSVALFRQSGTVGGLRELLELVTGGPVEVADSGGVTWSQAPNTPPPGTDEAAVVVRIAASHLPADRSALDALIAAAKPAHVTHRLEVTEHDHLP